MERCKLYLGDCMDVLPRIADNSVDMVLCDMPYGITNCKWDAVIPLDKMWEQVLRVAKSDAAVIFTASQPFTSALVMSNPKMFRHEWIYKKRCASNFAQAKYAPMKEHESVLVFGKGKVRYYPIKEQRKGAGLQRMQYEFSDAAKYQQGEFVGEHDGHIRNGQ